MMSENRGKSNCDVIAFHKFSYLEALRKKNETKKNLRNFTFIKISELRNLEF